MTLLFPVDPWPASKRHLMNLPLCHQGYKSPKEDMKRFIDSQS